MNRERCRGWEPPRAVPSRAHEPVPVFFENVFFRSFELRKHWIRSLSSTPYLWITGKFQRGLKPNHLALITSDPPQKCVSRVQFRFSMKWSNVSGKPKRATTRLPRDQLRFWFSMRGSFNPSRKSVKTHHQDSLVLSFRPSLKTGYETWSWFRKWSNQLPFSFFAVYK